MPYYLLIRLSNCESEYWFGKIYKDIKLVSGSTAVAIHPRTNSSLYNNILSFTQIWNQGKPVYRERVHEHNQTIHLWSDTCSRYSMLWSCWKNWHTPKQWLVSITFTYKAFAFSARLEIQKQHLISIPTLVTADTTTSNAVKTFGLCLFLLQKNIKIFLHSGGRGVSISAQRVFCSRCIVARYVSFTIKTADTSLIWVVYFSVILKHFLHMKPE